MKYWPDAYSNQTAMKIITALTRACTLLYLHTELEMPLILFVVNWLQQMCWYQKICSKRKLLVWVHWQEGALNLRLISSKRWDCYFTMTFQYYSISTIQYHLQEHDYPMILSDGFGEVSPLSSTASEQNGVVLWHAFTANEVSTISKRHTNYHSTSID